MDIFVLHMGRLSLGVPGPWWKSWPVVDLGCEHRHARPWCLHWILISAHSEPGSQLYPVRGKSICWADAWVRWPREHGFLWWWWQSWERAPWPKCFHHESLCCSLCESSAKGLRQSPVAPTFYAPAIQESNSVRQIPPKDIWNLWEVTWPALISTQVEFNYLWGHIDWLTNISW